MNHKINKETVNAVFLDSNKTKDKSLSLYDMNGEDISYEFIAIGIKAIE